MLQQPILLQQSLLLVVGTVRTKGVCILFSVQGNGRGFFSLRSLILQTRCCYSKPVVVAIETRSRHLQPLTSYVLWLGLLLALRFVRDSFAPGGHLQTHLFGGVGLARPVDDVSFLSVSTPARGKLSRHPPLLFAFFACVL